MYRFNFFHIQVFLAVAEFKNFSEAAKKLYSSQSAVSKQIKKLEDELQLKLFLRDNKNVILTEAGETLYNRWRSLYGHFMQAISEARQKSNVENETINLGIIEGEQVLNKWIKFLVQAKNENRPFSAKFVSDNFINVREGLENGLFDAIVTITTEEPFDLKNYKSINIHRIYPVILIGKMHPLYNKQTILLDDLTGSTMCTLDPKYAKGIDIDIDELCQINQIKPGNFAVYPNMYSMQLALNTREEICITYQELFNDFLARENSLRIIPFPQKTRPRHVKLIWQKNLDKKIEPLVSFVLEKLSDL